MNWKLVFVLSLLGLVMGVLSVLGMTSVKVGGPPLEFWLWLVTAAIMMLVVVRHVEGRHVRHGFFAAFLAGLVAQVVQFLFFETYSTNNPEYAAKFAKIAVSPRWFVLARAPVFAVLWGTIVGVLCWVAAKLATRRKGQPTIGDA